MTQMQLAKRLGYVSNSRVADWENGKNIPSPLNIKRLSDIFETNLVQYVDNDVPVLDIPIVKIIRQGKKANLGIVSIVKELESEKLITRENEKDIIKAIMYGKWIINPSSSISALSDLDEDEGAL